MTFASPVSQEMQAAFVAVLRAAAERGFSMTRTKIAKLLYLCDLRAVESGLQAFTGARWKWLHYGPFDRSLLAVEEALVGANRVARDKTWNYFGNPEYRLSTVPEAEVDLDEEFWEIVNDVVAEYGRYAPSTLRDLTYQTEPMLTAQERGEREVDLDLSEVRPVPDLAPALRRLRAVRDRLEEETTDPGAFDDIREENEKLAGARASANRRMLD